LIFRCFLSFCPPLLEPFELAKKVVVDDQGRGCAEAC
jgi:hypothetical protein